MNKLTLFENHDVTVRDNDLLVATSEARAELFTKLRGLGYFVNPTKGEGHWFAYLDTTRIKCDCCGDLSTLVGSFADGHKCRKCGEVMSRKLSDDNWDRKYTLVEIWDGVEYPAYSDDFPMPRHIHIFTE